MQRSAEGRWMSLRRFFLRTTFRTIFVTSVPFRPCISPSGENSPNANRRTANAAVVWRNRSQIAHLRRLRRVRKQLWGVWLDGVLKDHERHLPGGSWFNKVSTCKEENSCLAVSFVSRFLRLWIQKARQKERVRSDRRGTSNNPNKAKEQQEQQREQGTCR